MMFEARPLPEYKPPLQQKKELPSYTGIGQYVNLFEKEAPPVPAPFVPPVERKLKLKQRLQALHAEKNDLLASQWDPQHNPNATE